MNSFIKAKLVSLKRINVIVFTDVTLPNNPEIKLFKDDIKQPDPKIIKKTSNGGLYFYDLEIDQPYDFSARYNLTVLDFSLERVDVSNAVDFPEFDSMFYYNGDDLGCAYSKESLIVLQNIIVINNIFSIK